MPLPCEFWAAAKAVLLLVLVVLIALVVAWHRISAARGCDPAITGGGEAQTEGVALASASSYDSLMSFGRSSVDASSSGEHRHPDTANPGVVGGKPSQHQTSPSGATMKGDGKKSARRHWTDFESWTALVADKKHLDAYWADRLEAIRNPPTDWSGVRAATAHLLDENREWAGNINQVDGKLVITQMFPSRHAVGEGVGPGVAATISEDVHNKVWSRPSLFVFHTHPNKPGVQHDPSPMDIANGSQCAFHGHFAANLVISPSAIYMYGLEETRREALWAERYPLLSGMRFSFDVFNAFSGMRSYAEYQTLDELETAAKRYGMFMLAYANDDSFAARRHVLRLRIPDHVDLGAVRYFVQVINKMQQKYKIKKAKAKK